ncbi:MAG TPA: endopeptidase La [Clostridia bacterium]|nr:endopeptidase La [Clostridia bacterium]
MNKNENNIFEMPLVALRGLVVFPDSRLHFDVGRDKSIAALKAAMGADQEVFLVAQKGIEVEDPIVEELYNIGVIAAVKQVLRLPNSDNFRVYVEGNGRAQLLEMVQRKPYFKGLVKKKKDSAIRAQDKNTEEALVRKAKSLFELYASIAPQLPPDLIISVIKQDKAGPLSDYIAGNIPLAFENRQQVLNEFSPLKRLEKLCVILAHECEVLKIESEISSRVQDQIDENQKEYYLREQMKAISTELNDGFNPEDEIEQFRLDIKKLHLPEDAEKKLLRECDKLERTSSQSPESMVSRTYIETCISLPWNKFSKDKLDLKATRKILDNDHYGLEKVKNRIVEMLAVRKLSPEIKGQIICLIGPPGVGKTSVARSIARAMGRKYTRISLGGIHNEAEIRGHRKTYIGSMPGRIINAMQSAGTSNPLILLDEVDKLCSDFRGDPASALLEVMDGEQNFAFRDHYIEIPFDLSKVLFITTANDTSTIPAPLLDRMEIIELGSYTHEEKYNIAKNHLIPKQTKRHGLSGNSIRIDKEALRIIIDGYTREAGVRKLEQTIAAVCRKAAVKVADGAKRITVKAKDLEEILGPIKYRRENLSNKNEIGAVNGLAWTTVGGEMLKIEVAVMDGTGKLELTGSLGDVMKESAKTAVSLIRTKAEELNIDKAFYKNKDIHIHVPEGAVPKDGPSAGVTITTALASALAKLPVRGDLAMTGEITLTGKVLTIGGLREKSMAAYRAGIKTVLIPRDNKSDLVKVDKVVLDVIDFITVSSIDEVFENAFIREKKQHSEAEERKSIPIIESIEKTRPSITQ